MKTIQTRSGVILRVKNGHGDEEVSMGRAKFVAKKLWKTEVRDAAKPQDPVDDKPKAKVTKRKEGQ